MFQGLRKLTRDLKQETQAASKAKAQGLVLEADEERERSREAEAGRSGDEAPAKKSILKSGRSKSKKTKTSSKSPPAGRKQIRFEDRVAYDGGGVEQAARPTAVRGASVADGPGRTRGRQTTGQKGSQARAGGGASSPHPA